MTKYFSFATLPRLSHEGIGRSVRKYVALGALTAGCAVASSLVAQVASAQTNNQTYDQKCAACHQSDGKGIPEVYPKLAGNPFVTGDAANLIDVMLNGRGEMPAFGAQLDDRAMADLVTHIRNSWGNAAKPVAEADVKAARAGRAAGN